MLMTEPGPRRLGAVSIFTLVFMLVLAGCGRQDGDTTATAPTAPTGAGQAQAQVAASPTVTQPTATVAVTPSPAAQLTPAASPTPADVFLASAVRRVSDARKPGVVLISVGATRQVGDITQPSPGQQGIGSGAIFDEDGHIITNNHVVEGGGQLEVVLPDGRRFQGQLIGRDPRTDLAVVKIEGDNLPVVPLAPRVNVAVGDWVVAIGNALGLPGGPTVTAGVVSALGRSISEPNGVSLLDLIQTDAAINPGNSGGPLLNLNGEIVGINTAGIRGAEGLGFAVSVDTVNDVVPQLIQHGRVIRPFIGVSTQPITPGIAARFDLPVEEGLLIVQVVPNSPAAQAGLIEGDILVAVNGRDITSQEDLQRLLRQHQPGDTVTMRYLRNGSERETDLTFAASPAP